jgi:hypothetical protein
MSGTEILASLIAVTLGLAVIGFFWVVTRD